MDEIARRREGQALSQRCNWLRAAVYASLGTLLTVLFLLPGCGSSNQPEGAAAEKKAKTTASAKKTQPSGAIPLVMEEGTEKKGQVRQPSSSRRIEVLGGMTQQELEAKAAASLAELKKAEKNRGPMLDGMTQAELEAKAVASQKLLETKGGGEIFPGITQRELEEMAAKGSGQERPVQEVLPGATQEKVDASAGARVPEHREMFPPSGGK